MTALSKTRGQKSRPKKLHCVICGSTKNIELHHIFGRNNAPQTFPLCRAHHSLLTEKIRCAGISMSYTHNKKLRNIRALKAALMFFWDLFDELAEEYERGEAPQ